MSFKLYGRALGRLCGRREVVITEIKVSRLLLLPCVPCREGPSVSFRIGISGSRGQPTCLNRQRLWPALKVVVSPGKSPVIHVSGPERGVVVAASIITCVKDAPVGPTHITTLNGTPPIASP